MKFEHVIDIIKTQITICLKQIICLNYYELLWSYYFFFFL